MQLTCEDLVDLCEELFYFLNKMVSRALKFVQAVNGQLDTRPESALDPDGRCESCWKESRESAGKVKRHSRTNQPSLLTTQFSRAPSLSNSGDITVFGATCRDKAAWSA